MKEAFEKIRKKLEEMRMRYFLTIANGGNKRDDVYYEGISKATDHALSIVSEVEAEYGKDINVRGNKSTEHIKKLRDCSSGWISCEKELPPEPEENPEFDGKPLEVYLVSFKGTKYPWRAFWTGKNFTDGWGIVHPEAWMPLPEPYKPEKGV